MRAFYLLTTVGLLISGPLQAAKPQSQAERLQQLSEIVFQNYPAQSLAAGEQGPVYFIVKLDDKAHATSCEVTHGSGFPRLDEETCRLIVNHAVFKSALNSEGRAVKSTHEGVVNWRIPGTPQPPINPVAVTAATAPEKQICKRSTKIGSLAASERTCMTKREWDQASKETQDHWGQMQGKQGSTACEASNGLGTGLCVGQWSGPPSPGTPQ